MQTRDSARNRYSRPPARSAERFEETGNHRLDVFLEDGKLVDVHLDGESVYPTWFKIEWKETGEMSAKACGVRMATRFGDTIQIHNRP